MAKGVKGVNVEKEKEEEKGKSRLLRRQFDDQRYVAGDADRPKKTVSAPVGTEAKIDVRGKVENLLVGSEANAVADVRRFAHFAASLSFAHLYFLT